MTAGFATADFAHGDEIEGEGVGDDAVSWGFDGARNKLWHGGDTPWEGAWEQGSVIGFAANIVSGQIAVSEGGRWTGGAAGVKFTSDAVCAGVYPAITGNRMRIGYVLDPDALTGAPPSPREWLVRRDALHIAI